MRCNELAELLTEYLDDSLGSSDHVRLETHLSGVRRMRKLSHSIHIDDRNLESDPRGRLQAHAARYVIGALTPTAPLSFAGQPSSAQQQWIHQLCCRQRPSVFRWLAPTQPPLDRWSR